MANTDDWGGVATNAQKTDDWGGVATKSDIPAPAAIVPPDPLSQQIFKESSAGKLLDVAQGNWFTRPFKAAGEAVGDALIEGGRLGLSDESIKKLEDLGLYAKYNDGQRNVFQAVNNGIIQTAAVTGDALMRGLNVGVTGALALGGGFMSEAEGALGGGREDPDVVAHDARTYADALYMMSGLTEAGLPLEGSVGAAQDIKMTQNVGEALIPPTIKEAAALTEKEVAEVGSDAKTATVNSPILKAPEKSPLIDEKSGNLNLDHINASDDVKTQMARAAQAYADENGVIISHSQTLEEAQGIIDDAVDQFADGVPDSLAEYNRNDPANAAMVTAARKLVVQRTTEAWNLSRIAAKTGTQADFDAAVDAEYAAYNLTSTRHELSATMGRGLNAHQIPVGDEAAVNMEDLREKMNASGLSPEDRVRLMATFDSPADVAKFVRDVKKPTWGDMGLFYVINNYLSGPITHLAYTASWAVQTVVRAGIETPVASAVGRIQKKMGLTIEPAEVKALQGEGEGIASRLAEADSTQGRPLSAVDSLAMEKRLKEITDRLANKVTVMPGEAAARFYGIGQGALDSIYATGRALKTGNIQMLPGELAAAKNAAKEATDTALKEGKSAADAQKAGEAAYNKAAIYSNNPILDRASFIENESARKLAQAAGLAIGVPTRVIAGIHSLQKFSGYAESLNALAYRQAIAEGLSASEDIGARIAQLKSNTPPEMIKQAADEAKYAALMGKPGAFGQKVEDLAHVNGWTRMVVPFSRVVTNLANQKYLERTPLGFLSPVIRGNLLGANGNAKQATQIAKMLTGSTLLAGGAWLASQGINNGNVPDDPKKRAMAYMAGTPPYTVRIDDMNVPHRFFGVLGGSLSLGADVIDIFKRGRDDSDAWSIIGNTIHVLGNDMLQENALKGAADLYDAIRNRDQNQAKVYVLNAVAAAATPYSVGMSQVTRMIDPVMRSTAGTEFWERFKKTEMAHLPWESSNLIPRVDIFGHPMLRGGDYEGMLKDPVMQTLMRTGYSPAAVGTRLFNVKLNDQQYFDYATKAGTIFYHDMEQQIADPSWLKLNVKTQADMIHTAVKNSRKDAKDYMCLSYANISASAAKYCRKLTAN